MSLKLVGVVALAGLSAVAAYIFLFRKKEDDETVDEPTEEAPKTTEKDQAKDDEYVQHMAVSDTLEEDIAIKIGTIEDSHYSKPAESAEDSKGFEAGEDLTGKTESLMEWIDRQLKEAESKSRNATPAPESQIVRNSSPDMNKNVSDNNEIQIKETDTAENADVLETHITENVDVPTSEESKETDTTENVDVPALEESKETDTTEIVDVPDSEEFKKTDTTEIVDVSSSEESKETDTTAIVDVPNSEEFKETDTTKNVDVSASEESKETDTTEIVDVPDSEESKEADTTVIVDVSASEESNETDTKEILDVPDSEEFKKTDTTEIVDVSASEESKEIDTTENADIPASEESLASEIQQVEAAALVKDTSTSIKETTEMEKQDDSMESIEIIEMIEVENVSIQEEVVPNNALQPTESQEIIEPQPTDDDCNEKCIQEEDESIEIIDIKLSSQENIDGEIIDENSKNQESLIQHSTNFNAESKPSIRHTNEVTNISSIECIDLRTPDTNANSLVTELSDIDNKKDQFEVQSSSIVDINTNFASDFRAATGLSDGKISEVSPDKNGLAVTAECAGIAETDLVKTADIEIESLKDPECSKNSPVDEDSDAEIQLLKEVSENKNSNILEDSDFSENDSDSGSSVESVNTEVTVDGPKSDEDSVKEINGNSEEDSKDEFNESIGLMLRPSWQIKKPQKTLSEIDAKLTSI